MPATLTRNQMRLYQRERRARLKTGSWPTTPKDTPCRPAAPPPAFSHAPTRAVAPTPAGAVPTASTFAIGGRPGRGLVPQGYGYAAPPDIAAVSTFTKWCANTETMLAALAAKSDAQERRIAALEAAAAGRRANTLAVVQAIAGLFSFAVRR
jgi:hypothetical protein